jgi:hypothetical protein
MAFGQRPDTQFVEKTVLDGSEHIYSQEGGSPVFYTLERAKDWVLSQSSFDLFDIVDTEANLPSGGSINPNKMYIVRNYNSTSKTITFVYDSSLPGWRQVHQEANPFVIAANIAGLPPTGNSDRIYHVLDGGNGQPRLMRWNGSIYIDLDQDNQVYQVSNVAARNALTGMQLGNVCIMTDSDGSGNRGVSWYTGSAWTTPITEGSGGGGGGVSETEASITVTSGNVGYSLRVVYTGSSAPTASFASNKYTIAIPGGTRIKSANLLIVSADVQMSADAGGFTGWVQVEFQGTGGNTSLANLRVPTFQKLGLPATGTLSVSNSASYDLDNNPALSVVAVGSGNITLRISGLSSVGPQGYLLTFTEI